LVLEPAITTPHNRFVASLKGAKHRWKPSVDDREIADLRVKKPCRPRSGDEADAGDEGAESGDGTGGPAVGVGYAGVVEVGLGRGEGG